MMFLLVLAAGMFFVVGRGRASIMDAGVAGFVAGTPRAIDWKLLARVTMYVETAVVLALVALHSVVAGPDIVGGLAAGLIVAFIVHLLIGPARK